MLRRLLATVLMQAAFLALPGVVCVAWAALPAPAKKCTVAPCAAKRTVVRSCATRCCDARPIETATTARRDDPAAAVPVAVKVLPLPEVFPSRAARAHRPAAAAFRAPLVLRL